MGRWSELDALEDREKRLARELHETRAKITEVIIANKTGVWDRSPTQREAQVLLLAQRHLSNKEIAASLNISERTVKLHISNLLKKAQVQSRYDL